MILLSLLTNLSKLVLPRLWLHPLLPPMTTVLDKLAIEASRRIDRPFSRLEKLESWGRYEDEVPLDDLQAFFVLPKFHDILCMGYFAVVDEHINKPFDWRFPGMVSELRELKLLWCCVTAAELEELLLHTPKLESFKLEYTRDVVGCDWDVNAIVKALQKHCGSTLADISITVDKIFGVTKGGLRDFQPFSVLENLELDLRFFFGPPVTEALRHMSASEYRDHALSTAWDAASVPRLIDMLPSTIKTVRLLTGSDPGEPTIIKSLFKGWHIEAVDALPSLEGVLVMHGTETVGWVPVEPEDRQHNVIWWSTAREAIAAAGCSFGDNLSVTALWVEKILDEDRA